MSESTTLVRSPFVWIRNKFLAGLAVVIPLVVTFWILRFIYDFLHEASKPLLESGADLYNQTVGPEVPINVEGKTFKNFATFIGFLVPVAVVVALGAVATNVIGARLVLIMDKLMLRIPMISFIYKSLKQVIDAFKGFGGKNSFKRVVYVEYPSPGMRLIGFVTGQFFDAKLNRGMTCVFLPASPSPMTGLVIVADDSKVVDAPLTMEEAMKMIFSGGLIGPDQRPTAPVLAGLALATPKDKAPDSPDFVHLPKADEHEWEESSTGAEPRDRAA